MHLSAETAKEIKERIVAVEPEAKIVLYGSYARGDANEESDIDLLILIDKPSLSYNETKLLTYPLHRYGSQTDQLISPLVKTKKDWEERCYFTPLYHNVQREGIEL